MRNPTPRRKAILAFARAVARSLCTLLLAAAACSGSGSQLRGPGAEPAPVGKPRLLTIVGINDIHGSLLPVPAPRALASVTRSEIGGAEWLGGWVKAVREDAREKGGEVLLVDGGDEFQGTLISNQFQGRSVVEVFNALGVAAAAVGNHEFDFGMPALLERMREARYPMLAANIFKKGTRERPAWAKPSAMLEVRGLKIGVIGLATVETPLVTNPLNVADLDFLPGGPIAAREADALRAQGATVVLVTAHAGPFPPENEIQRIAESLKGRVDLIVSGHHHVSIGPPPLVVDGIPIVQAGSKLQNFSIVELALDDAGRVRTSTVNDGTFPKPGGPQPILHTYEGLPVEWRGKKVEPDAGIAAILAGYDAQVRKLRETRIGSTAVELRKGGPDYSLGNLVTDAFRSGAGGSLKADFALANSGGLRISELPVGPISFGQVFDLYPFDNEQVVVSLPAQKIRDALEAVLRQGKGPLQVSGLRYTIDWERFEKLGADKRVYPAGAIVTQVVDASAGKPLCETSTCSLSACQVTCAPGTYTVSVTDFLANGGDGLTMLKDAPRKPGSVLARDIIVSYVKEHDPITARLLGGGEQRIVVNGSPLRQQSE